MKTSALSATSAVKFKDTELGPLPEDWQVVRLGEVVERVDTGDWGYDSADADKVEPAYVLRGTDFARVERMDFTAVPIRYLKTKRLEKRTLSVGDVLVELSGGSKDQPTGRVFLVSRQIVEESTFPISFSNFVKRLRLSGRCDAEFFTLYWQYLYQKGATRTYEKRTTGIRNFKLSDFLSNECIPLPPLPEQRAIAHVLRTVQRAREATERVIAALRDLKKSLMRHLFTYGPRGFTAENAESAENISVNSAPFAVNLKETEIGPLPEHWQVVRLGEVADARAGVAFPPKYQGATQGKFPFYKVSDMNLLGNEIIMGRGNNWVDENTAELIKAKPFPPGTILFPKVGGALYTNKKRLLGLEAFVDNNIMGVTVLPDAHYDFYFLFYWVETIDLKDLSNPGPLPSINARRVKDIPIPLPPLPDQREIARILQVVDRRIAAEEAYARALGDLFKALLHELMSGRKRIKLTAENAESAEKSTQETLRPRRTPR